MTNIVRIREEDLETDVFERAVFRDSPTLYLMLWNWGDDIYQTDPQQVRDFFMNTEWWYTRDDLYIFPVSMDWVIVITHEEQIFVTYTFLSEKYL